MTEQEWDALRTDWFNQLFEKSTITPGVDITTADSFQTNRVSAANVGQFSYVGVSAGESRQVIAISPAVIDSFTATAGGLEIPALRDWHTGNLLAGLGGIKVIINEVGTGSLVTVKTGLSSNTTTGIITVNDPLLVPGTEYRVTVILANGAEGTWRYTAS